MNVYVIDTGIRYSHNDFGGRAYSFWDYQGGVSIPITWSMWPEKKIQRTIPHLFLILVSDLISAFLFDEKMIRCFLKIHIYQYDWQNRFITICEYGDFLEDLLRK